MAFVPTATLSVAARECARRILAHHAHFHLYFEAALAAQADLQTHRQILIGAGLAGVALSIDFAGVTIRTTVGELAPDEIREAITTLRPAELHLEPAHLAPALGWVKDRIIARKSLRYYRLDAAVRFAMDPRCRWLGRDDEPLVSACFRDHYPTTVFSSWMLDDKFLGLFEGGELLACGGVIVRNRPLRAANIGNMLTHPAHRGRGLAKAVARSLIGALAAEEMSVFLLAATEDNPAAWHAYQAVGFRLVDTRPQLDLAAAA